MQETANSCTVSLTLRMEPTNTPQQRRVSQARSANSFAHKSGSSEAGSSHTRQLRTFSSYLTVVPVSMLGHSLDLCLVTVTFQDKWICPQVRLCNETTSTVEKHCLLSCWWKDFTLEKYSIIFTLSLFFKLASITEYPSWWKSMENYLVRYQFSCQLDPNFLRAVGSHRLSLVPALTLGYTSPWLYESPWKLLRFYACK